MKFLISLVMSALLLSFSFPVFAKDEGKKNALVLTSNNLGDIVSAPTHLTYERKIISEIGLYVGFSVFDYSWKSSALAERQVQNYRGIVGGVKKYFETNIGLMFMDFTGTYNVDDWANVVNDRYSLQAKLGYQYFLSENLSLQGKFGVVVGRSTSRYEDETTITANRVSFPTLEFCIGMHW